MKRPSSQLFWKSGNRTFTNKWDLLEYSTQFQLTPEFHFFNDSFQDFDWQSEPEETFSQLCIQRAQQLRDQYQYLRFFYSGGVDSQTALNIFLKNNIYLDEILVYRSSVFTENFNSDPAELEITQVAIPFLKSIENQIPRTKITILETSPQMLTRLFDYQYLKDESAFAIRPWHERHLYKLHPKLLSPFEKGLFHADIRAGDKPKLIIEDDKIYMAMWDSSRIWDIGDQFLENFYLSPHFPELHCKQCHLVKNYILKSKLEPDQAKSLFNVFNQEKLKLINQLTRDPLYLPFDLGKGVTGVQSSKQILVEEYARRHNPRVLTIWEDFLDQQQKVHPSFFNQDNIVHDFKGILSPKYLMHQGRWW